jgi:hypothetical protein
MAAGVANSGAFAERQWHEHFGRVLITLAAAAEIQSDAGTLTLDPATGNAVTGTFAADEVDGVGAGER